jgi:hypothetical protein
MHDSIHLVRRASNLDYYGVLPMEGRWTIASDPGHLFFMEAFGPSWLEKRDTLFFFSSKFVWKKISLRCTELMRNVTTNGLIPFRLPVVEGFTQ